jgi:hypothetical protein
MTEPVQDFGKSWASMITNSKGRVTAFVDFEWGARMHPGPEVAGYNENTVFATVYETGDHAPHGYWDEKINFVRSDDFFTTPHKTTVKCGNAFEVLAEKVRLLGLWLATRRISPVRFRRSVLYLDFGL